MEIGIDIEEIDRFKNFSDSKLKKIFTESEISYAKKFIDYEKHLCAFWCVKEATIKAFSNTKINFLEIEINHKENGCPFIVKNQTILNELNRLNLSEIKISISHSNSYATATCLIY